jgi:hypothetical protein
VRNIFLCNNTLKIVDQFAFQTSAYQSSNAWGETRHTVNNLGVNLAADRLGGSVQVCIPFIFHILVIKLPHYLFFLLIFSSFVMKMPCCLVVLIDLKILLYNLSKEYIYMAKNIVHVKKFSRIVYTK